MWYHKNSYDSATNPEAPANNITAKIEILRVTVMEEVDAFLRGIAASRGGEFRNARRIAIEPTIRFSPAATRIQPACPRVLIKNIDAEKHATADPSVLTQKSEPTDSPTFS